MKMNKIKNCVAILAACVCASTALAGCDFSKYASDMQKKVVEDLKNEETKASGIEIGYSSSELKGKNYKDVETLLKKSGFTNITVEALGDMKVGILVKEGEVDTVSIGGATSFRKTDRAEAGEAIVIRYHSYPVKETAGTVTPGNTEAEIDRNTPSQEETTVPTPAGRKVIGLNEDFANSTIRGKVISADLDYKGYNSLWTSVPEGKKVILIVIQMTNISDKDNYVSAGDFTCYADNIAVNCEIIESGGYDYNENISPGRAAVLGACYIVPANVQSVELEYTPIGERNIDTVIKIL